MASQHRLERRASHLLETILQALRQLSLADGRVEMVIPGHDAEVMVRYPASGPGLEGVSVRLD